MYLCVVRNVFRKCTETFSDNFSSRDTFVTKEFILVIHLLKVQIYGCKRVFYVEKFRKVPLGKFPPEENSPESISDNFGKFRKVFPAGWYFGKFLGKFHKNLLIKNIIYRL
jgi:hypothetical protein